MLYYRVKNNERLLGESLCMCFITEALIYYCVCQVMICCVFGKSRMEGDKQLLLMRSCSIVIIIIIMIDSRYIFTFVCFTSNLDFYLYLCIYYIIGGVLSQISLMQKLLP